MDNKLRLNFYRHSHNKFNFKLTFAKQLVEIKQQLLETKRINKKLNELVKEQTKELTVLKRRLKLLQQRKRILLNKSGLSKRPIKFQPTISQSPKTIKLIQKNIGVVGDEPEFFSSISLIESPSFAPSDNQNDAFLRLSDDKNEIIDDLPLSSFAPYFVFIRIFFCY